LVSVALGAPPLAFVSRETATPQLRPYRVDTLHQLAHLGRVETTREVARRRRIRDEFGTQRIHIGRVMPQALDVLQPRAATQHVVGQIQHVVGLVIRQMRLQQLQRGVDRFRQAQFRHQRVHGGDTAVAHRLRPSPDLVVHSTRAKHRLRLRRPVPRPGTTVSLSGFFVQIKVSIHAGVRTRAYKKRR